MPIPGASLLQAILDPILVVQENGVIVDCNQAAWRFFNADGPEWLIGHSLDGDSQPVADGSPSMCGRLWRSMQQALAAGNRSEEWVLDRPDGSTVAVDVAFSVLADVAPRLVLVHWHDISRQRQRDEQVRQRNANLEDRVREHAAELVAANAQLAKAAQHKDEFLAAVSHELRTPLMGVMSFTQALEENVYGVLPERQRRAVQMIHQAGEHLLLVINGILDLARLQTGELQPLRERVAVAALCRLSLRVLDRTPCDPPHRVAYKIDRPDLMVEVDERRIVQMLYQLLGNAAKFTPPGGEIVLDVQSDLTAGEVTLSVSDNGIGIDPVDLPRLFQPFVQLDGRLSRRYPGVGIGLALVRGIAELHGGSVGVESTPGAGSRFWVTLPLCRPDENPAVQANP